MPTLECDQFDLTSAQGQNTGEKLGRFRLQAGELVMADAAYCNPPGIAAVKQQGAEVIVRLNPVSLPLQDPSGRPWSVLGAVKKPKRAGEMGDWPVGVPAQGQPIAGRVCGLHKSEQAIEKAQRKLTRKQQQGKGQATEETRQYACYVLVFTTLPVRQATSRQVLDSYRLRWQIEFIFKRLKSIVQLGHVPKQDDRSSRAWLYGMLLVALLSQKLARVGSAISPWGYPLPEETAHPQSLV